jgi:hypothetical protein
MAGEETTNLKLNYCLPHQCLLFTYMKKYRHQNPVHRITLEELFFL